MSSSRLQIPHSFRQQSTNSSSNEGQFTRFLYNLYKKRKWGRGSSNHFFIGVKASYKHILDTPPPSFLMENEKPI